MKKSRANTVTFLAACVFLAAGVAAAAAQTYPSRPITIVVPYPAGGPTDTLARILAEYMKTSLGQSVVVENVTGAGGSIGVGRVARADPDGYTVSIGHWNTHVVQGATMNLAYDVLNDFEPVSPRERQTPEALGAHQKAEIEKWWPIIKAAGIRVE
jgi:tripartite-type tricarboxylate transporter receptor subunit TctC